MSPRKIDRYLIVHSIGKGGMAEVYQAHDPRLNRDVALKVIRDIFSDIPEFRESFRQEAKTIARLEHRAIVPVHDFGEDGDKLFLVMRLMKGESLRERLNREKKIPPAEASFIMNRLAAALEEAHRQGIVHRDIKPANVLSDMDGLPFLSDFGIAHIAEETDVTNGRILQPDGYVGSPAYMAPEQWLKESPDAYTDVYQLGIMLFEMLTGRQPFQGQSRELLKEQHLKEAIPSAKAINPDLPNDCDRVLATAMAKNPLERFDSPGELAEALAKTLTPIKVNDHYLLQEELTHGRYAAMYLARDLEQELDVALKLFKAPLLSYPKFQRQFERLAESLKRLDFSSILPLLQVGIHQRKPYLVMPFVRGDSLYTHLQDNGRFLVDEIHDLLLPLARDIDAAAKEGHFHRNITPQNILLHNGQCYLSNFGAVAVGELTETVVHSEKIIGSYPYMAPEQWRYEPVDSRTNVYQFGVMLFELLAGKRPFMAEEYEAWMEKHLHEPVPSICRLVPDLPQEYDALFQKALAKERDGRYSTVTHFVTVLGQTYNAHIIETLYNEALVLYRQGDLEPAIEKLEQVAELNPTYREVKTYLQNALDEQHNAYIYEQGKREHGRKHWNRAIRWLEQIPDYRDATVLLKEAKFNQEKERLYQKGLTERDSGKITGAHRTFKQLARQDPNYKDLPALLRATEKKRTTVKRPSTKILGLIVILVLLIVLVLLGANFIGGVISSETPTSPFSTANCLAEANIALQVTSETNQTSHLLSNRESVKLPQETSHLEVVVTSPNPECADVRQELDFDWHSTQPGTLSPEKDAPYRAVYTPNRAEKDSVTVYIQADDTVKPRSILVDIQLGE